MLSTVFKKFKKVYENTPTILYVHIEQLYWQYGISQW